MVYLSILKNDLVSVVWDLVLSFTFNDYLFSKMNIICAIFLECSISCYYFLITKSAILLYLAFEIRKVNDCSIILKFHFFLDSEIY